MSAPLAHLLDQVLDAGCDIDNALELAGRLGWTLLKADNSSGKCWVMMKGPVGPCVSLTWAEPEVRDGHRYANATFKSFYGAVVLALLHGLAGARQMDADVAAFTSLQKVQTTPKRRAARA